MVKFIYLTDTHIGADPIGYHQQPAYPERITQLLSTIQDKIKQHAIDFVIHGGDLVNSCQPTIINQANSMFKLSVPVYFCLGNHDLDHSDALNIWLKHAPDLFIDQSPNFEIVGDTCVVHVIPNHWEKDKAYYWKSGRDPYLVDSQIEKLESGIQKYPDKMHILVTHNPVYGMDPKQSGFDHTIHEAPAPFRKSIDNLTKKYSNLEMVLSGHSHINTLKQTQDAVFITGSSFVETPFEYKIIEITKKDISVATYPIDLNQDDFEPRYNPKRSYTQGQARDRNFSAKNLWASGASSKS